MEKRNRKRERWVSVVPQEISLVAPNPALTGEAGERFGLCTGARLQKVGNKLQVVLTFRVETQTANMWIQLDPPLTPACRYMRMVGIALGHQPASGEDLSDPEGLFCGKWFRLQIGYRKTAKPRGKGKRNAELANTCKDPADFLRIHDLLARED